MLSEATKMYKVLASDKVAKQGLEMLAAAGIQADK
jgi:hypothetical protein